MYAHTYDPLDTDAPTVCRHESLADSVECAERISNMFVTPVIVARFFPGMMFNVWPVPQDELNSEIHEMRNDYSQSPDWDARVVMPGVVPPRIVAAYALSGTFNSLDAVTLY